jgi:integrase
MSANVITPAALQALAGVLREHPELSSILPGAAVPKKPAKKRKRRLPNFLTPEEEERFLAAIEEVCESASTIQKRTIARRDRMIVRVGLLAGPRVSEICKFTVRDVDLAQRTLLVREGKGCKDRLIQIGVKLLPELTAWIGDRKDGPLFPGPYGYRLTTRTVQQRLEYFSGLANVGKKIKPHTLRHTFATRLVQLGVDIETIRDLLGHNSIQITSVYLHSDSRRHRAAVDLL